MLMSNKKLTKHLDPDMARFHKTTCKYLGVFLDEKLTTHVQVSRGYGMQKNETIFRTSENDEEFRERESFNTFL